MGTASGKRKMKKIEKIIMGYYAGPFRTGDPPGVPFRGAFQTIKHLQGFFRVPIFAAVKHF